MTAVTAPAAIARVVAWAGLLLHAFAAVGIAANAFASERLLDGGWGAVALLATLIAPAVVALIALLRTPRMLALAASAALALAFFPFSVHSFALIPAAAAYVVGYVTSGAQPLPWSQRAAAATAAALAVGAMLASSVHLDPRCWEAGAARTTGLLRSCSSNVTVWWEALLAVGLSALLIVVSVAAFRVSGASPRRGAEAGLYPS